MSGTPEPFTVSAGTAVAAAPLNGGRHRRSLKKLRLVKKKTVRRMLARAGLKMRGGDVATTSSIEGAASGAMPLVGARRRRHTKKTHRRSKRSLFGLKY